MNLDVAKTIEAVANGLKNLSPAQISTATAVLFIVLAPYWYHRIMRTLFSEMQSQRRDAIEVMESARKSHESLLRSLPAAREPLPRLEESPATPEPPKAGSEPKQ
jgi:hypothetical protein